MQRKWITESARDGAGFGEERDVYDLPPEEEFANTMAEYRKQLPWLFGFNRPDSELLDKLGEREYSSIMRLDPKPNFKERRSLEQFVQSMLAILYVTE